MSKRIDSFLKYINRHIQKRDSKSPYKSFRLTYTRDKVKKTVLPGYFALTLSVVRKLWSQKKLFLSLAVFYAVWSFLSVGILSEDIYSSVVGTADAISGSLFDDTLGALLKPVILTGALFNGSAAIVNEGQQLMAAFASVIVWLTTVWLLRNVYQGHKVRMRDGLYNAGAPMISTIMVTIVALFQLLPLGIVGIVYTGLSSIGYISSGIESMVFWIFAVLVATFSLYWATGTFLAMIIVTLPGTYPLEALKAGNDLVLGNRLQVLLRLLWLAGVVAVGWLLTIVPIFYLDVWLKTSFSFLEGIPLMPVAVHLLSVVTAIWTASYVYILYRAIVEGARE